ANLAKAVDGRISPPGRLFAGPGCGCWRVLTAFAGPSPVRAYERPGTKYNCPQGCLIGPKAAPTRSPGSSRQEHKTPCEESPRPPARPRCLQAPAGLKVQSCECADSDCASRPSTVEKVKNKRSPAKPQ